MPSIRSQTVENGLPIHHVELEGTRAATVLVAFEAGARTERADQDEIEHDDRARVQRGRRVGRQPSIADIVAKALYGLLIYKIARTKSFVDDAVFEIDEIAHDTQVDPARPKIEPTASGAAR